jgi:hypothetical protein
MKKRKLRAGGLALLVLVAALFLVGGAAAVVNTYFGPATMPWLSGIDSATSVDMTWNRVYRPKGYDFALWYNSGTQYAHNSTDNPFWHHNGLNNADAWCANNTDSNVSPTTCQYGT